ncbi:MAG: SBBP repeat-containing protein, partial [Polyangiaceae bacterium]
YDGAAGTVDVGPCKSGMHTCQDDGTWGECQGQVVPSDEVCSSTGDEDCNFGAGCSEAVWAQVFGDVSAQTIASTAFDQAGNIYVVGKTSGTLAFGNEMLISSGNDAFVAKLAPDGVPIWARSYGDANDQSPQAVAVDSEGNVIVAGDFSGSMDVGGTVLTTDPADVSIFVIKLDPQGTKLWARQFGDTSSAQGVRGVALGPADDVVLAGSFAGKLDFDGKSVTATGGKDVFLATLSAAGTGKWANAFGDAADQLGQRMAVDKLGNIFVAGGFFGEMTMKQGLTLTAAGADVFLARFDSAGTCSWAKKFDCVGSAAVHGLDVDGSGDVVVSIETNAGIDVGNGTITPEGYDAIVAKYSSGGSYLWQAVIGSPGDEYAPKLAVDAQKRTVLAFYTDTTVINPGGGDLPSGGGYDIVVVGLEPDSSYRWAKRYGLIGDQSSPVVSVGPKGEVLIAGNVSGEIDFGLGVLMPKANDIAVALLGPN